MVGVMDGRRCDSRSKRRQNYELQWGRRRRRAPAREKECQLFQFLQPTWKRVSSTTVGLPHRRLMSSWPMSASGGGGQAQMRISAASRQQQPRAARALEHGAREVHVLEGGAGDDCGAGAGRSSARIALAGCSMRARADTPALTNDVLRIVLPSKMTRSSTALW